MPTFALITEGITDQVVLEIIIQAFYSNKLEDEVDVNPLQPPLDATDEARQGDFGGWEKVLQHCSIPDRITEALDSNDYVVIQIDTDCCEKKNFDVSLTIDGVTKSVDQFILDVKEVIVGRITQEIFSRYEDRFLFAIAVHSIECWLLPLHAKKEHEKSHTLTCEDRLRYMLSRENKILYVKDYPTYKIIAKDYKKIKNIETHKSCNRSLEIFINNLPDIVE